MKGIIDYINEQHLRIGKNIKVSGDIYKLPKNLNTLDEFKDLNLNENDTLEYPISLDQMGECIKKAFSDVNNAADIFHKNDLDDILVKCLGRLWEKYLAKALKNEGIVQGKENAKDKDLIYKKQKLFSIEVKTSKRAGSIITGNASYVKGQGGKDKNSFYLIIKYKLKDNKITSYESYFGYVLQNDWKTGEDNTNSATLSLKPLLDNQQLVKIQ